MGENAIQKKERAGGEKEEGVGGQKEIGGREREGEREKSLGGPNLSTKHSLSARRNSVTLQPRLLCTQHLGLRLQWYDTNAPVPAHLTLQAKLPNLRRLFVEARTEVEENEYSRTAVRVSRHVPG